MKIKWFLPAIAWFIISVVLLVIPGNDLPHSDLFDIPFFDKYVHLTMFFLLTSLFALPFLFSFEATGWVYRWLITIAGLVILYGILMEFVQKYLVTGRSFDVNDIFIDSVGSLLAYVSARQFYAKKIGPDGNQGRNQN